jgi:hypothetical protein
VECADHAALAQDFERPSVLRRAACEAFAVVQLGTPAAEIYLHFHGVTAEDIAAVVAHVNQDHGQDV